MATSPAHLRNHGFTPGCLLVFTRGTFSETRVCSVVGTDVVRPLVFVTRNLK